MPVRSWTFTPIWEIQACGEHHPARSSGTALTRLAVLGPLSRNAGETNRTPEIGVRHQA
jgi:hypothetical protein